MREGRKILCVGLLLLCATLDKFNTLRVMFLGNRDVMVIILLHEMYVEVYFGRDIRYTVFNKTARNSNTK